MKKFVLSLPSVSLVLLGLSLPISGFASSKFFTQLVNKAITSPYVDCGKTSDSHFCSCFTQQIIKGCNSQPIHPPCTTNGINTEISSLLAVGYSYSLICKKFNAPVSPAQCATDLKYWHEHASCRD